MAVLNALEGWLSGKAAKQGVQMLEQAEELYRAIKLDGNYFPIDEVQNTDIPNPDFWRVSRPIDKQINLAEMKLKERKEFAAQHNVSWKESLRGTVVRTVDYFWIHNGDPFIYVKGTDGNFCAIKWDAVCHFAPDHAGPDSVIGTGRGSRARYG